MAAERRNSPSTLPGLSASQRPIQERTGTPLPQSRQRLADPSDDSPPSSDAGTRTGPRQIQAEPAAPPLTSARQARFSSRMSARPDEGLGFYSWRPEPPAPRPKRSGPAPAAGRTIPSPIPDESDEFVFIPPPPRLPQLDLEATSDAPERASTAPATERQQRPPLSEAAARMPSTIPPPSRRTSSVAPARASFGAVQPSHSADFQPVPVRPSQSPRSRSSQPPLSSGTRNSLRQTEPPAPTVRQNERPSRRPSQAPPRIYFSPHVRRQAEMWSHSGSLSLPGCSSPRHARAVQRALLLALLTEPGFEALPQGLRQRVGWLFCEGWESGTEGHNLRELDDLATVLSLPPGRESRELLVLAVEAVLPHPMPTTRPPSSRRGTIPPSRS